MNIVAAMLNNWQDATNALQTGLNSAGSAMNEFANIQESTQYKLNEFRNSVIGFWQNLIDQQGIKTVIDSAISLINVLTKVTSTTGLLPPVIALISFGFMTLNTNLRNSIMTSTLFEGRIISLTGALRFLGSTAVTTGTFLLRAFPIMAILTAVSFGLEKLINHFIKAKTEAKELEKQNKQLVTNFTTQNEKVQELIQTYQTLDSIKSRTDEQEQRYLQVQNDLNSILPTLTSYVDEKGQAHLKNAEAIQEELKYLEKLTALEKEKKTYSAEEDLNDLLKERNDILNKINDKNTEIQSIKTTASFFGRDLTDEELANIKSIEIEILTLQKNLSDLDNEGKKALADLGFNLLDLNSIKLDDNLTNVFENIISNFDTTGKSSKELIADIYDLADVFKSLSSNKDFVYTQTFEETLISLGRNNQEIQELRKQILGLSQDEQSVASSTSDFNAELKDLQSTMSKGISNIQKYNKALDEYNQNGKFNLETIIELAKEQPQLLEMLGNESALRKELTRLVEQENKAIKTAYAEKLMLSENYFNSTIKGTGILVEKLGQYYNTDLENSKNLAEAKLKVEKNLLSSVAGMWAKFYNAQGEFVGKFADAGRTVIDQYGNETYVTPEMRKQLGTYLSGVRDIENRFKDIALSTTKVDFSGVGLSSDKSSSSSSQFNKTLDLSKQKIEDNLQLIEKLKDALDDATSYDQKNTIYDQLTKQYQIQLDLLKQQKKMQNDQLYVLIQQIQKSKLLTAEQKKQVLKGDFSNLPLDGDKYKGIAETIEQYQSLKSTLNSTINDINNADDLIRDNIFAKINDNITVAQDEIAKYNNELDISESKLQLITEGTDEYNQELAKQSDLRQKLINASTDLQKYVEQELANDKLNIEQKKQLQQIYNDLTKSILGYQVAQKQSMEKAIDDAIELIKDSIKKREELEVKALQNELDMEEKRHNERIKNLDDEYDKFEENINKQIALIDEQADEDEFNKQLKEAQDKRNETMRQISVFSMDDSFEAKKRVAELQKQLAEQNAEIEDMQNKRTIELRKKNLNDQLDKFKTEIDEKKETEDARFEAFKEEKQKEIEETQLYYEEMLKNEQYFQSLKKRAAEKGTSELKKILTDYLKFFNDQNETYTGKIGASWQEILNTINAIIAMQDQLGGIPAGMITPIPGGGTTTPPSTGGDTGGTEPEVQLPAGWSMNTSGGMHKSIWGYDWGVNSTGMIYKDGSFVPATNYQYVPNEVIEIAKRRKAGEFAKGGIADYTGYAMLHGTKQKSEVIFNAEQAKKLYNLVANLPQNLLTSNFNLPNISNTLQKIVSSLKPQPTASTSAGNIQLYVSIDKMNAKDENQVNQVFTTIANKLYAKGK